MSKKCWIRICLYFLILSSPLLLLRIGGSNDLVASLANLPGLADSPDKGALVDLVKAIDEEYTAGTIKIEVFPFARSMDNVIKGKADFHIPIGKNPIIPVAKLPYNYVSERMGKVSFVIYSSTDRPITKEMLDKAVAKGGKFPYVIEASPGSIANFPFPAVPSYDIAQTLKKVESKRIDAAIRAQEETDRVLRDLKIKTINRANWGDIDDCIIIAKSTEGERIDKIISGALKKLKASGKLQQIYSRIHSAYDNWQPSKMGW